MNKVFKLLAICICMVFISCRSEVEIPVSSTTIETDKNTDSEVTDKKDQTDDSDQKDDKEIISD